MDNKEFDIVHEAEYISLVFLSEIEKQMDKKGLKKSELAKMLNTSKSYLTQLWRGDKILSLAMIAKMQKVLKIKFTITTTNGTTENNAAEWKGAGKEVQNG